MSRNCETEGRGKNDCSATSQTGARGIVRDPSQESKLLDRVQGKPTRGNGDWLNCRQC